MKRAILIFCTVLLFTGGLAGCSTGQGTTQGGDAAAAQTPAAQENVIWASGKLVPARWAALSPAVAGTVKAIHVAEGDRVETGKLLIELDGEIMQRQVEVAAAAVAEADAARAKVLAGATPSQVAGGRAELAAAQAGLAAAQANLKQAQEGVNAAVAQVAIAQAQYAELASRPTPAELLAAQRAVDQAQVAVDQAQAAYDTVRGDPHIAARPEALALQQATAALNSAKATYAAAVQGATPQQLAVAQALVDAAKAQAQVARTQAPSAEAAVSAAQARIAGAQAALDALVAGATAEDKAQADGRVKSAQAALAASQAQARQTQVSAPFAGQIGAVYARPGELALPGQPVLALGDMTQMRIETTDLRETDVARLKLGIAAEVTFDALSGRTFQGTVTRIAPMSSAEKGSTNYTAIIEVADLDPSLRWGMTAFVNIRVDK